MLSAAHLFYQQHAFVDSWQNMQAVYCTQALGAVVVQRDGPLPDESLCTVWIRADLQVHMDFAAKHNCLVVNAPQDLSYGGSGVHPISSHGVLVSVNLSSIEAACVRPEVRSVMHGDVVKVFFTALSSDTVQDSHWVHTHLQSIVPQLKDRFGVIVRSVHAWSDNCDVQYKCRMAIARLAVFEVPACWNFCQARHGKSDVDCLTSVWRSMVDTHNGQGAKRQLLRPEEIVQHMQQRFADRSTRNVYRMCFEVLSREQIAASKADKRFAELLDCKGITRAHSFRVECSEGALEDRTVRVQGLSGYRQPEDVTDADYAAYLSFGAPDREEYVQKDMDTLHYPFRGRSRAARAGGSNGAAPLNAPPPWEDEDGAATDCDDDTTAAAEPLAASTRGRAQQAASSGAAGQRG